MVGWFDSYVYLRPSAALKFGMTHYGWYYFVPIYISEGEAPIVGSRIPVLDLLMEYVLHPMEALMNGLLGNENMFMFKVGARIDEIR
jgi:hypothetical protein